MPRIVICGGARAGKTTLAHRLSAETGLRVISTDSYIGVPWDSVPEVVILSIKHAPDWILEGVQAARVLRRWLRTAPDEAQVTRVYWLGRPVVERTGKQESSAKGVSTVFESIRGELLTRNIPIVEQDEANDIAAALR